MVKGWREGVWRNAERLLAARTDAQRQRVTDSIETNAVSWANLMAAPQTPGYRAQRDAYCAAGGAKADRALELFARSRTTALPVAAGAFLLGAISRADVERALRSRRTPKRRQRFSAVRATA